jgi:hypothetical protein
MIECIATQKTFSLGIGDVQRDCWVYHKGAWRKMKPKDRDTEWYCEEYEYGTAETQDMLECWLQYLPGVKGWCDYGDMMIDFNMDEVEEEGWDEQKLKDVLGDMARFVKMRRVIHAKEPWLAEAIDAWGHKYTYYRHPAIDCLDGMIEKEYPNDLTPDG